MKKITLLIVLTTFTLLIVACTNTTNKENNNDMVKEDTTNQTDSPTLDEQTEASSTMADFLLADGSKAHYQGEGNEFAELDIEVQKVGNDYYVFREDNGGSYIQSLYKIEKDKITILQEANIDFDDPLPTLEELNKMQSIGIYLQRPFIIGATFDKWTIIETDGTLETPYQVFNRVIVIESIENDFINRKYFAPGFGEVKREAIMETDDGEFIVTSTLESIEH